MKNTERIVNIKLNVDRRNDVNIRIDTKQEAMRLAAYPEVLTSSWLYA